MGSALSNVRRGPMVSCGSMARPASVSGAVVSSQTARGRAIQTDDRQAERAGRSLEILTCRSYRSTGNEDLYVTEITTL